MSESMSYKPNDYADILKLINDNNYAKSKDIIVKRFEHLYVLKYVKSQLTTENINSLGLFRSIIVDKDGNIVSFAHQNQLILIFFLKQMNMTNVIFNIFQKAQ